MSIPCGLVVLLLLRKCDLSVFLFSMSHPEPVCSVFLLCLLVTVIFICFLFLQKCGARSQTQNGSQL